MKHFVVSETRNSKGFWTPEEIRIIPDLEWIEKVLLVEIINLCKLGECYASNNHFGGYVGVSGDRAGRLINRIAKLGYIRTRVIYKKSKNGKPEVDKRIIAVNTDRFSFFTDEEKKLLDSQIPIGESTVGSIGENTYTPIGESADIKNTLPKENIYKESTLCKGAKTKVLCAENLTDQFDYDIVRRQISKVCMEQGVSNAIQISDIQDIIIAFLMAYRYEKGEDHPRISQKEIGNIVDKIVYPIEELDGADLDYYKLIIERYFAKDYERGCDYHISHFFNENIQKILCYEADYREVENIFA